MGIAISLVRNKYNYDTDIVIFSSKPTGQEHFCRVQYDSTLELNLRAFFKEKFQTSIWIVMANYVYLSKMLKIFFAYP